VLFSDETVAAFINENFEATWQSVRPVPIVTIDFGGGHVLHRTLNGNIATHVCTADGKLLDVLPGVYEPKTFLDRLDQFVKLHQWVRQSGLLGGLGATAVADYHRRQAEALANGQPRLVFQDMRFRSKIRIENLVKFALMPGPKDESSETETAQSDEPQPASLSSREDLANWKLLAEDTEINETVRRRMIHDYLAGQMLEAGADQPELLAPVAITKWLYREVLHADIDDPYLGLGKVLFASYPFDDHE